MGVVPEQEVAKVRGGEVCPTLCTLPRRLEVVGDGREREEVDRTRELNIREGHQMNPGGRRGMNDGEEEDDFGEEAVAAAAPHVLVQRRLHRQELRRLLRTQRLEKKSLPLPQKEDPLPPLRPTLCALPLRQQPVLQVRSQLAGEVTLPVVCERQADLFHPPPIGAVRRGGL